LVLEFSVEFSTFSGEGSDSLPPPRQIDQVESTVTVPDGQTVIVGGLRRNGETYSIQGIPYLEKIPIVRDLSTLRQNMSSSTSFFLFIRPMILRDDKFEDLKHVSMKSTRIAEIGGDYPSSRPLLVE
jgi:type II secretory pathway component GspD/PulD (secretin)